MRQGADVYGTYPAEVNSHLEVSSHLETSSYTGALLGEPIGRFAYFARHEIMANQLPFEGDFGVRRLEKLGQSFDARGRNDGIHAPS